MFHLRLAEAIAKNIAELSSPIMFNRRNAADALWTLAYNNPSNKIAIRKAQGIGPLVSLLNDADDETVQNAARALGCLAYDSNNQNAIREAQAIVPLVRLLKHDNSLTRGKAAGVLSDLAFDNSASQEAIREAQGIASLVDLLNDVNVITIQHALRALKYLALNNVLNQIAIIDCGALSRLAELALRDEEAKITLEACQPSDQRGGQQKKKTKRQMLPMGTVSAIPSNTIKLMFPDAAIAPLGRQFAELELAAYLP